MPESMDGFSVPPHAYVPGATPRHPEDWFDRIKASVTDDVPSDALHTTAAWQAGLAYLEAGYFWECHEVLEAVWMQTPEGSPERDMTQALIQLANAQLKIKMEKPRAALRLCAMVAGHLSRCDANKPILGLTSRQVQQWVEKIQSSIKEE